jgi:N-acetyl-gamma-glutamyl-phosphate reductase
MIRVAVVGATGYAGAELVRILAGHPKTKLAVITSRQYAGVRFDQVYPAMAGRVEAICQEYSPDLVCEKADVIFFALPHKLPMAYVPEILGRGKRVVDLSADFRFTEAAVYESVYQPHTAKEFLESAVYGLCEIYADQIKAAALIGNPGCYPTSVLLPLVPLLKQGLLDPGSLIADSKSGVSGAGRSLALASHFCEVNESFKAYKVAAHRHNPEMNAVLTREAQEPVSITFVPHLVPMSRGMLTTIYASTASGVNRQDIIGCYRQSYGSKPFIRICSEDRLPNTLHVRGTNFCDIGLKYDEENQRLVLISAIDNLVKGAAGQAVQNMNLMMGLEENAGLSDTAFPV